MSGNHDADRIVEEFSSAWQRGERPEIAEFLRRHGNHPDLPRIKPELMHIDLDRRLALGERAPVLTAWRDLPGPELGRAQLLKLIRQEYGRRRRRGDSGVRRKEYIDAFPDLAAPLSALTVEWDCPKCHRQVPLADELAESIECPHYYCGWKGGVKQVFGRPAAISLPVVSLSKYKLPEKPIVGGGMGEVYRGVDPLLGRPIAVKLLRREEDRFDRSIISRFHREARIGARLDHPGVVPIHEFAHDPDRGPFLAMKLVDGMTLRKVLEKARAERTIGESREPVSLTQIFLQICQTMAYAHSRGILHRDLKPENVMIGAHGLVQVMDWGLARDLADPPDDLSLLQEAEHLPSDEAVDPRFRTTLTLRLTQGQIMGTPEYMAPEQTRSSDVDRRADVFALGAILCEMLTGDSPYIGPPHPPRIRADVFKFAWDLAVGYDTPPKPEQREVIPGIVRLQDHESEVELAKLAIECLDPDPEKRPQEAGAVSRRVSEYLTLVAGRAEEARLEVERRKHAEEAARLAEQARIAAENEAAAAAEAARAAEAKARAEEDLRRKAEEKENEERKKRRFARLLALSLLVLLAGAAVAAGRIQILADDNEKKANDNLKLADENQRKASESALRLSRSQARTGIEIVDEGNVIGALPWFVGALENGPKDPSSDRINRIRLRAMLQSAPRLVKTLPMTGRISGVDRRGRWIATVSGSHWQVLDTMSGQPIGPSHELPGGHGAPEFSPDGRFVLIRDHGAGGPLELWDAPSGRRLVATEGLSQFSGRARFSEDGTMLVTWLPAPPPGPSIPDKRQEHVAALAEMPADFVLPGLTEGGGFRAWKLLPDGRLQALFFVEGGTAGAISPDNRQCVVLVDGRVETRGIPDGKVLSSVPVGVVEKDVEISLDGRFLRESIAPVSAQDPAKSTKGSTNLWDVSTGRRIALPSAEIVRFGLDSSRLLLTNFETDSRPVPFPDATSMMAWAAGSKDSIELRSLPTGEVVGPPIRHEVKGVRHNISALELSPDGLLLATGGEDGFVRLWWTSSGMPAMTALPHEASVRSAVFSLDGRYLITVDDRQIARIWDMAQIADFHFATPVFDAGFHRSQFSSDGRRLVTFDRNARVWDVAANRLVRVMPSVPDGVAEGLLSPRGDLLLLHDDRSARVFGVDDGKPLTSKWVARPLAPDDHARTDRRRQRTRLITGRLFAPDQSWVATAYGNYLQRLKLDPVPRSTLRHYFRQMVESKSFAPDDYGEVVVWDVRTGEPRFPKPIQHRATINHVVANGLGDRLATASNDFTARLWDARTGDPLTEPLEHPGQVWWAEFNADATRLITACQPPENGDAKVDAEPKSRNPYDFRAAGQIFVWDLTTAKPSIVRVIDCDDLITGLVVGEDGRHFAATCRDFTVRVWRTATGEPVCPPLQHRSLVNQVCFSSDEALLLTSGHDGRARIWETETGVPVSSWLQHAKSVIAGAFFPSNQVVTIDSMGIGHRLDVAPERRSLAELNGLATLYAGYRLDPSGGRSKLGATELEKLNRDLVPEDEAAIRSQVLAWRASRAWRAVMIEAFAQADGRDASSVPSVAGQSPFGFRFHERHREAAGQ